MKVATRTLLLAIAACLVVCTGPAPAAQQPAEPPFTLKQIGPNVWAAIDNRAAKMPAGSNAGFVIGDDGVIVVDSLASRDAAAQLLAAIRSRTTQPVKFVVNTHYHIDHVAGDAVFADAGATIVAHRNVHDWVRTENLKFFATGIKPEQRALVEAFRQPSVVYDTALNMYVGSREVQVRFFPGHTGGDSVVLIPDAKAAFGGDLFWCNTLPNLIDASTQPWIETLDRLTKSAPDYTFVPGHGEVGKAQDVTAFRDYLMTLRKLVADAHAQGKTGDAAAAAVLPALTEKYSSWDFFSYFAQRNIADTDAELRGTKKIPQPSSNR